MNSRRSRVILTFGLLVQILGAGAAGAASWTCYATGETFSTCSTIYSIKSEPEVLLAGGPTTGSPRRSEGAFKFNVSAVPATAVAAIEFHFYVGSASSTPYWSITPVTSDPVGTLAGPLWTDIDTEASSGYYNFSMESGTYTPGWKSKILGGTAPADLTAIVNGSQEWFAFGALVGDGSPGVSMHIPGYSMANPPYIVVYDDGIAGPTGLTCNSTASTIQLAWTNNDTYSSIEVWGDGALVATLPGTSTSYNWVPADKGVHCAYVEAFKADGSHEASGTCCAVWGFSEVSIFDFNASDGGFTVQGTGAWEWGPLTYGPCAGGAEGNVWATRLAGNYDNGVCWILDSSDIELTDKGGVVCFDHCYEIEPGYDGGNVWFTTDDYWYYLFDPSTRPYPGVSNGAITDCPWVDARPIFTGDSGGWVSDCWELTDPMWADEAVKIRLAFGSDTSVVHDGWAMDNLTIYTNLALPPSCWYTIVPPSGTVPFLTQHRVTLTNYYLGGTRRMAGRIDVRLANGSSYSNWRSGYTNIVPGASFVEQWNQTIPALTAVIGNNQFILLSRDVTPSPYNQPPYPPSGDTCNVTNTVTAGAP